MSTLEFDSTTIKKKEKKKIPQLINFRSQYVRKKFIKPNYIKSYNKNNGNFHKLNFLKIVLWVRDQVEKFKSKNYFKSISQYEKKNYYEMNFHILKGYDPAE